MAEQLLSTDPTAGTMPPSAPPSGALLSTDPIAGRPADFHVRTVADVPKAEDFLDKPPSDPGIVRGVVDSLNPIPLIHQLYETAKAAPPGTDWLTFVPKEVLKSIGQAHLDQIKKSWTAFQQGHISEGVGHLTAAAVPLVGPAAAKAGEDLAAGKPRYAVGEALGTLLPFLSKYATEAARTGSLAPTEAAVAASPPLAARLTPRLTPANPQEAAAATFGASEGVPMDAATATGNRFVRGVQKLADESLGGSVVAEKAQQGQAAGLADLGSKLANEGHPTAVTPEQAGESVRTGISGLVDTLHAQANDAYDRLRELERAPEATQRVAVPITITKANAARMRASLGTPATAGELQEMQRISEELKAVPYQPGKLVRDSLDTSDTHYVPRSANAPVYQDILQAAPGTSRITAPQMVKSIDAAVETGMFTNGAKGALEVARQRLTTPYRVSSPLLPPGAGAASEALQAPVDLKAVKQALQPVYEQMKRQLPLTQQMASPGLKAIENLVAGPDYAPLSQVDRDLSAIKSVARSQGGIAKLAVRTLDSAVQAAADALGPEATSALQEGRAATVAKHAAQDVLERIRAEPVQAFRQATAPHDAGIVQLRHAAELAPGEMPKIGRAVLDDMLGRATEAGAFDHSAKLYADWQKLGDETKRVLYGDPAYIQRLDRFFTLAKSIAQNPNPSGSALTLWKGGELTALVSAPAAGIFYSLSMTALSKLLHSDAGVQLLTRGLKIPIGNAPMVSAWTAEVAKVAGDGALVPKAADDRSAKPPTRVQR